MNKNKTILYILGGGALIAGVYYLTKRFRSDTDTETALTPPGIIPPVTPVTPVTPVIPVTPVTPVVPVVPPVIDQIGKFPIGTSVNTTKDTNLYKNASFDPLTDFWGDFEQIKKGEYLGVIQGKSGAFTIVGNYSSNNTTGQNQLYILNGEMVKKN